VKPLLFSFGPFHLYGYGVMIMLGLVGPFWFLHRRMAKVGLKDDDEFWIFFNFLFASGFVGARVLYLFEYTRPFSADFWQTLVSPSRGFSLLGGFISLPLFGWFYCRWKKLDFLRLADTVAVMTPAWLSVARLGCLLAGCCYGRPTDEPWGIVFRDPRSQIPEVWRGVPLHPTQLYEVFGQALITVALYLLLVRTENKRPGLVLAGYWAAYGLLRFVEEYYRGDTVPLGFLGLTAGQGLGVALMAASIVLVAWRSACSRPS